MNQPNRPVRPIDEFHDQMMAKAEAEQRERAAAALRTRAAVRAEALLEAADAIDAGWFTTAASATAELRRLAGEQPTQGEALCPGFPDRCPNLRTVEPNPPEHYGGIRCGCGDEQPPA